MAEIQKVIIDGGYAASQVLNGDETGMMFGAQPKYQYVSHDADRATALSQTTSRVSLLLFLGTQKVRSSRPLPSSNAALKTL